MVSISSLNYFHLCQSTSFLQNVFEYVSSVVQSPLVNTVTSKSDFQSFSSNKAAVVDGIVNTATCNSNSFSIWHSKLGHLSATSLPL